MSSLHGGNATVLTHFPDHAHHASSYLFSFKPIYSCHILNYLLPVTNII